MKWNLNQSAKVTSGESHADWDYGSLKSEWLTLDLEVINKDDLTKDYWNLKSVLNS